MYTHHYYFPSLFCPIKLSFSQPMSYFFPILSPIQLGEVGGQKRGARLANGCVVPSWLPSKTTTGCKLILQIQQKACGLQNSLSETLMGSKCSLPIYSIIYQAKTKLSTMISPSQLSSLLQSINHSMPSLWGKKTCTISENVHKQCVGNSFLFLNQAHSIILL